MAKVRVGVVGATGVLGREVVAALAQASLEPDQVTLLASERSEGDELDFGEETLPVEKPSPDTLRGLAAVVLAVPPEVATPLAEQARKLGVQVIDASGAVPGALWWPGTPLPSQPVTVLPSGLGLALAAAAAPFAPTALQVVAVLPASSVGRAGVEALERQTAALLNGKEVETTAFPHRLAFNVIPEAKAEESRAAKELATRWPQLQLQLQAMRAAHFHGALLAVTARAGSPSTPAAAQAAVKAAGLKLLDEPESHVYPMPMLAVGDPAVQLGQLQVEGAMVRFTAAADLVALAGHAAATLLAATAVTQH